MPVSDVLTKRFALPISSDDAIFGEIRYTPGRIPPAVVVVSHSFMAFKEWGFFPHVGEEFARRGYCTVTFNFSWNGVAGHGRRITDFERFSRNTFTREFDDLGSVLRNVREGSLIPFDTRAARIVLLGHSRGAGISILRAVVESDIAALVTWSSVSTFDRWTDHQKKAWRSSGKFPLARSSAVSPLYLRLDLLTDLEMHREALDILRAGARIRIPWLIVHGSGDLIVPFREAEALRDASPAAELVRIDGAGHLFNAASKKTDRYATLDTVIGMTDEWLKRVLQ